MTWLKDALERRSFWPYELSPDPVKAVYSGYLLRKGKRIGEPYQETSWKLVKKKLSDAGCRWDVCGQEWDQMELQIGLSVDNPSRFFPVPCFYTCTALCKTTRWRSGGTRPFSTGTVFLPFKIYRKDVAGDVLMTPMIILGENRSGMDADIPSQKGVRLAIGYSLHLQLDPPQESPGAGIEILWHRFPDEIKDSMYQLIIEPPHPILRLNNQHPSLKVIFESRAKIGHQAKIRNALFSTIAADVWIQLAEFAVRVENLDLDDPDDPTVLLGRKILNTLSRMIKRPVDEILFSFDDHTSRSQLTLRIQHHLKTLSHQDGLIRSVIGDGAIEEGFD